MSIKRFEDIKSWQLARNLTGEVYKMSCASQYGVDLSYKDQLQRACISIMSNIAEGFESGTNPAFIRYLKIAKASVGEVRSLLHVGADLGYIEASHYEKLLDQIEEISKLIYGLIRSLK